MPQFPFYSYPKVYITVRTRIPPRPTAIQNRLGCGG